MKMTVTIYHNPRCSKSRQTLTLLNEKGVNPNIREYLKDVPSADEMTEILEMLGMEPRDLMRKNEVEYKENNLDDPTLSRDALIKGMVSNPKLIERPIVIKNGKASIGRPPTDVLKVL